jgi:hypothetical protein
VRWQLPMGQRCGKFSRSARQRTMLMRARSMSSGDSDAISRSFISASVSGSFVIEWGLLRSRGATRGLFRFLSSSRREGTARQAARQIRMCTPSCEDMAPSGAPFGVLLRRRAALYRCRSYSLPASPFRRSLANAPAPVATQPLLAAGRSPDAAQVTGAGAGPFHTSRRNRFASLMERTTIGMLSYRNIVKVRSLWKRMAQEA